MAEKVKMQNSDASLMMVKDDAVIHHSWNMGLLNVEFVRRKTGELPGGAWVGTVTKLDGEIMAMSSRCFYDVQFPAPHSVHEAIMARFE